MKIKTSELRSFLSAGGHIKTNNILPILQYIKFDNGRIIKNNLSEFIVYETSFAGSILVEERLLSNLVSVAVSEYIEISKLKNRVVLTDGSNTIEHQYEPQENFPLNEEPTSEGEYELTPDDLLQIGICSDFCHENHILVQHHHLYITDGEIFASNNVVAYFKKTNSKMPTVQISKPNAKKISALKTAVFSQNDSYMFFVSDNIKYGFIKAAGLTSLKMGQYMNVDSSDHVFTVDRSEFVNFSNICTTSTPAKIIRCNLSLEKEYLKLSMVDDDYSVSVNKTLKATGSVEGVFCFDPNQMNRLCKSLPDQLLTFHQFPKKYLVTGQSGFVALIMEYV